MENMETLDEASGKKKKKLRNVPQKLMTEREEMEKRVQSLEEPRSKVPRKEDDETERVTALFRDLRGRLEDLEKRVLSDNHLQAERVSLFLMNVILEIKKEEMGDIEELCNMTDPLTVLQESDTGDLCDTEDGDDEDRERHDKLLHEGTHVYPHLKRKAEGPITPEPSRKHLKPCPTTQHVECQVLAANIGGVQQTSGVSVVTDILLDVRTERFQCNQVMSSQRFSSGRHHFEVDVGAAEICRVGMCYPSIERKGSASVIGDNNKSWCLERRRYNQYAVVHDRKRILLPGGVSIRRVRIDLDYEAGQISFYDLCDPIRHLHTFTTTFTEPLHAVLLVIRGQIPISAGNQKRELKYAQRQVTSQDTD